MDNLNHLIIENKVLMKNVPAVFCARTEPVNLIAELWSPEQNH